MDQIQRKLAQIDKRLGQIDVSSPLVFAAVGLIVGIILQNLMSLPASVWLILLIIFFCLTAVISCCVLRAACGVMSRHAGTYCGKVNSLMPAGLGVAVCAVCLGAIRLISYQYVGPSDINNLVGQQTSLAKIRGVIVTKPYVNYDKNWKFTKFSHSDPSTSFYLKLTEAETVDGWAKVSGVVRVQLGESVFDLNTGDSIQAYCTLGRFRATGNPGQFPTAEYMARRNVYVAANIKSAEAITVLADGNGRAFVKLRRKIRQIANQAILGDGDFQQGSLGLLEALLLGQRGNIKAEVYSAFEKTGLLHFISLSGMHLGILAAVVWWLGRVFGLLKRGRAIVCMLVIALFLMVVPARGPTVRAAIICFVFCLAEIFTRRPEPLNSLSLAAVILLLIRPMNLFEVGWQLSFASVLSILSFCYLFYEFLKGKLVPESARQGQLIKLWCWALAAFSTGFAAWLGGAGILLYHFYTINPLTSLWTVIVFPLIAAVLIVGFAKAILWFLLPTVSAGLAVVMQWLGGILIWVVEVLSRIEFGELLVGKVSLYVVVGYYFLIVAVGWACLRGLAIKKIVTVIAVLSVIGLAGAVGLNGFGTNGLELSCLDVGHGQSVILQTPKRCLLFDAGSQHRHDIGRRTVGPFLRFEGIDKIDAIVISHDDIDHINGIPEIVADCEVGAVYANNAFIGKIDRWGQAKFLAGCLAQQGLSIKSIPGEIETADDAAVKILWPDVDSSIDESLSDNDASIVSLIEFAGRRILICSDIESYAQRKLFERFENLSADIVIVPHHGSLNTMAGEFLERLNAEYLICSCGQRHYQRLQQADSNIDGRWFYTYKDGAVKVNIDKAGKIKVSGFRTDD